MAAGKLVLITGGTGHIGYPVIVAALKAGYSVRAAVRSKGKIEQLLAAPSLKALAPGDNLTFVEVPDLTIPGAYDHAVKDVDYIIHIASPLPSQLPPDADAQEVLIKPAVQGTLGILESARKTPSVKRIVITSSIGAIFDFTTDDKFYNDDTRVEPNYGPYPDMTAAYMSSKAIALKKAEEWIAQENPNFEVIHLLPSFVQGADELVTDYKSKGPYDGSNMMVTMVVTGVDAGSSPGFTVHLDNVVEAHINALDPKISGHQSYLLTIGTNYQDAWDVAVKYFPEEVKNGTLKEGKFYAKPVKFDTTKAEKELGIKFKDFETQAKDVIEHHLKLKAATD